MTRTVSVVGLGKLGACMAATMAQKDIRVIGVDINDGFVAAINEGRAPVVEPQLAEMIAANRERLSATKDLRRATLDSEISFVIVPTPSDARGAFVLEYAQAAMREIGAALKEKVGYHLVVLTSTALPGSCDNGIVPVLEAASGKKAGRDFGFCYNPEFIALGTVIRDLLNPDFVLIGESDPRAGETLEAWYKTYLSKDAPVSRMNYVNAELTKIALNTFVTTKISYANMLAALCEKLPGANVDTVTRALGQDSRIGAKCLMGGLGYGGPCFPRDNRALAFIAKELGAEAPVAQATDRVNNDLLKRVGERLLRELPKGAAVTVLGVSYKPDSVVCEESHGLALARALADAGCKVAIHDRVALPTARNLLGDRVAYAEDWRAALKGADAIVIGHPGKDYAELKGDDLPARDRLWILDCWRQHGALAQRPGVRYLALGTGTEGADEGRLGVLWGGAERAGAA